MLRNLGLQAVPLHGQMTQVHCQVLFTCKVYQPSAGTQPKYCSLNLWTFYNQQFLAASFFAEDPNVGNDHNVLTEVINLGYTHESCDSLFPLLIVVCNLSGFN